MQAAALCFTWHVCFEGYDYLLEMVKQAVRVERAVEAHARWRSHAPLAGALQVLQTCCTKNGHAEVDMGASRRRHCDPQLLDATIDLAEMQPVEEKCKKSDGTGCVTGPAVAHGWICCSGPLNE